MTLLSDDDTTWDIVLADVFSHLPLVFVRVLCCVNRRFRNLSQASYWKPDLLLYSWGVGRGCGHTGSDSDEILAPRLLEIFYSPRQVNQISMVTIIYSCIKYQRQRLNTLTHE